MELTVGKQQAVRPALPPSCTGVVVLALALICTQLLAVTPAHACSFVPRSVPEAVVQSDAVFSGTVTRLVADEGRGQWRATVQVDAIWKGPVVAELEVVTPLNSSCATSFVAGEAYLIYAYELEGALQSALYTRTAPLAHAEFDLAQLGPAEAPDGAHDGEADGNSPSPLAIAGYAVAAALAVTLVGGWLRRHRRRQPGA